MSILHLFNARSLKRDNVWQLVVWCVAALLCATLAAQPVAAQQDEQPQQPATASQLIRQAFEKTSSASTVDDYTQILELCDQARQANPSQRQAEYLDRLSAWALNRRGELFAEQAAKASQNGDSSRAAELDKKALADFEQAVRLDPTRWQALHNRGVSYAQAGRLDEAIKDFLRVTQLQPEFAKAWFNLGEARYAQGDFERAVQAYNRALQSSPGDARAYVSRGHAQFQLRRYREALADYERAVRLRPDDPELITNRADARQSLGMWQSAAADYRRAVQLDRNFIRALLGGAWLMATCPDPQVRDARLALEWAERAVQLASQKDHRLLETLAAAQANAGQFEQAQETQQQAIELAPPEQRQPMQARLELYRQNRPYRQPEPQRTPSPRLRFVP